VVSKFRLFIFVILITQNVWPENTTGEGPAYLVYAGPYSSSPSSAFGHLFLVFQRHIEDPLPLWSVVSFTAQTNGVGPISYMYRGIVGGFSGSYQNLAFHQKTRDYEVLEDRDLWLVELSLPRQKIDQLEKIISQKKGISYPYTFFCRNCAYYIQDILAQTLHGIPKPSCFVSPMDVLKMVHRRGFASTVYHRLSKSQQVIAYSDSIPVNVTNILKSFQSKNMLPKHQWLNDLTHDERLFVQEFLTWKTLHLNDLLSESVESTLRNLRLLNATHEPDIPIQAKRLNPYMNKVSFPKIHPYGKLSLTPSISSNRNKRLAIRYRPALHAIEDPWTGFRPINTLELLAVQLSAKSGKKKLRIDEFTLYSQASLTPTNWITQNSSWLLDIGAKRRYVDNKSLLSFGIETGIGKTFNIFPKGFIHFLFTGELKNSFGIGRRIYVAPGLDSGIAFSHHRKSRFGLQHKVSQNIFDSSQVYSQTKLWLRYDISAYIGVTAHVTNTQQIYRFAIDIDFYI
jgi:hypothetical protein